MPQRNSQRPQFLATSALSKRGETHFSHQYEISNTEAHFTRSGGLFYDRDFRHIDPHLHTVDMNRQTGRDPPRRPASAHGRRPLGSVPFEVTRRRTPSPPNFARSPGRDSKQGSNLDLSYEKRYGSLDRHVPAVRLDRMGPSQPQGGSPTNDLMYTASIEPVRPRPASPPRFEKFTGRRGLADPRAATDLLYQPRFSQQDRHVPVIDIRAAESRQHRERRLRAESLHDLAYPGANPDLVKPRPASPPNMGRTTGRAGPAASIQPLHDLVYERSYRAIDAHVPATNLSKSVSREARGVAQRIGSPADLVYRPNWAAVRPRSAGSPDFRKATGRRVDRSETTDLIYCPQYTQLDRSVPAVQIGSLESRQHRERRLRAESLHDLAYPGANPDLVKPRPASPPNMGRSPGRSAAKTRALDLTYSPSYAQTDPHVPAAEIRSIRMPRDPADRSKDLIYDPNLSLTRPRPPSAPSFRKSAGRSASTDPHPHDLLYRVSYAQTDRHMPATQIRPASGGSVVGASAAATDLVYNPNWRATRPRSASPPNMARSPGREHGGATTGRALDRMYEVRYGQVDSHRPAAWMDTAPARPERREAHDLVYRPVYTQTERRPVTLASLRRPASAGPTGRPALDLIYRPSWSQVDRHTPGCSLRGHQREAVAPAPASARDLIYRPQWTLVKPRTPVATITPPRPAFGKERG
ncbi:hypothetical protein PAPYR_146 [Paratrimastix pyriformis]|uniref:Uncharacterized protein n=1 Tax=Paratrimastix pyriformis TaxID=342808 RepID=A0ABQ8UUZ2_9EUKA|nr:hypothetical protein PAPYR_146 [Paratrimastix pyriformis]